MKPLADMLPYASPPLSPQQRWWRFAGYALIVALLVLPVIQFQNATMKALRRAQSPEAAMQPDVKKHRGAIGRWRDEIRQFWNGQNIYLAPLPPEEYVPRPRDALPTKHPNMPFVVVLLTPFAYMPVPAMALTYNLLKLLAAALTILGAIAIANDGDDDEDDRRMPDWLALLGALAGITFIVGDIQHGNTNTFVALAVVAHLWLFRRGHDALSGATLALGICLKLTPALFILYWAYQRQWKVLLACAIALPMLIFSPAIFVDWSFFALALSTWWNELVHPGLIRANWYPVHVNQSLPAMVGRYFTSGDSGNIFWDPDDAPVPTEFGWITLLHLGPQAAKWIVRGIQVAMVITAAVAIGWRRLRRDDGRRALHAGIVCSLMLLLNQRTWDHHATHLVIAHLALAYAAAFANLPMATRRNLAIAQLASVLLLLFVSGDVLEAIAGEEGSDRLIAYGTAFWHFLLVWLLCAYASFRLRRVEPPYRTAISE